jgi:hypothetical protein
MWSVADDAAFWEGEAAMLISVRLSLKCCHFFEFNKMALSIYNGVMKPV